MLSLAATPALAKGHTVSEHNPLRRDFVRGALQSLVAVPLAGALPESLQAQRAARRAAPARPAAPKANVNVRDLGATGDGKTKDTLALQQALDRVSVLGGGEVLVPAGDYLTGALRLHSNTTLRLEDGAALNGSPDIADYPLTQVRWEGRWIKGYGAFVSAQDAETHRHCRQRPHRRQP